MCGELAADFDLLNREVERFQASMNAVYGQMAGRAAEITPGFRDLEDRIARPVAPTWALSLEDPFFSRVAHATNASILELTKQTEAAIEPF